MDGIYDASVDPTKFPGPSAVQYDRNASDNQLLELSTRAGHEQFITDLSDSRVLLDFVGQLMPDWKEPFRFRRQLLRTNIPRSYKTSTRVHYDQMYLRRMEPGAVTGWIPIGDVSPVSGGLMYLEDSMPMGLEIERAFMELNGQLPKEEQLSAFNQNVGLYSCAELTGDALRRRTHKGRQGIRGGDAPPLADRRLPRRRRRLPPLVHDPLQCQ